MNRFEGVSLIPALAGWMQHHFLVRELINLRTSDIRPLGRGRAIRHGCFLRNRHRLGARRRNPGALLTTDADRSSFFIALVAVDVLAGLADAVSGPYIVLFLVDQA